MQYRILLVIVTDTSYTLNSCASMNSTKQAIRRQDKQVFHDTTSPTPRTSTTPLLSPSKTFRNSQHFQNLRLNCEKKTQILKVICINLLRFSRKKALNYPGFSTKIWEFDINTVTFSFEIPVKQNKNSPQPPSKKLLFPYAILKP